MVMSSTISVAGVGVLLGVLNLLAAVCAHFLPETNEGELSMHELHVHIIILLYVCMYSDTLF